MTVEELIEKLSKISDKTIKVVTEKKTSNGCDTCVYGAGYTEVDIDEVNDLETRVVLAFSY